MTDRCTSGQTGARRWTDKYTSGQTGTRRDRQVHVCGQTGARRDRKVHVGERQVEGDSNYESLFQLNNSPAEAEQKGRGPEVLFGYWRTQEMQAPWGGSSTYL